MQSLWCSAHTAALLILPHTTVRLPGCRQTRRGRGPATAPCPPRPGPPPSSKAWWQGCGLRCLRPIPRLAGCDAGSDVMGGTRAVSSEFPSFFYMPGLPRVNSQSGCACPRVCHRRRQSGKRHLIPRLSNMSAMCCGARVRSRGWGQGGAHDVSVLRRRQAAGFPGGAHDVSVLRRRQAAGFPHRPSARQQAGRSSPSAPHLRQLCLHAQRVAARHKLPAQQERPHTCVSAPTPMQVPSGRKQKRNAPLSALNTHLRCSHLAHQLVLGSTTLTMPCTTVPSVRSMTVCRRRKLTPPTGGTWPRRCRTPPPPHLELRGRAVIDALPVARHVEVAAIFAALHSKMPAYVTAAAALAAAAAV